MRCPSSLCLLTNSTDTQLNALDADRDLFQAELILAQIRYTELTSVVQLYKTLGEGGSDKDEREVRDCRLTNPDSGCSKPARHHIGPVPS